MRLISTQPNHGLRASRASVALLIPPAARKFLRGQRHASVTWTPIALTPSTHSRKGIVRPPCRSPSLAPGTQALMEFNTIWGHSGFEPWFLSAPFSVLVCRVGAFDSLKPSLPTTINCRLPPTCDPIDIDSKRQYLPLATVVPAYTAFALPDGRRQRRLHSSDKHLRPALRTASMKPYFSWVYWFVQNPQRCMALKANGRVKWRRSPSIKSQ